MLQTCFKLWVGRYQERLQRNLFYLASLADAQLNNVTASQLAPGNRQDYAMQKQPIPPGYFDKRQQQQLYSPRPGNVYANTTLQQSVMESSDVCVVSNRQSCFGTPETTVVPKFIESSNAISAASQQAATEQSVGQNSSSEEKREVRYWTQEEHERFVEGLSKYQKFGKPDLKAIAAYLGTRTPTQVRETSCYVSNGLIIFIFLGSKSLPEIYFEVEKVTARE